MFKKVDFDIDTRNKVIDKLLENMSEDSKTFYEESPDFEGLGKAIIAEFTTDGLSPASMQIFEDLKDRNLYEAVGNAMFNEYVVDAVETFLLHEDKDASS